MLRGDGRTVSAITGELNAMAGPGAVVGNDGNVYQVPGATGAIAAAAGAKAGGTAAAELPYDLAGKGFAVGPNGTMAPIPGSMADPSLPGRDDRCDRRSEERGGSTLRAADHGQRDRI